MVRRHMGCDLAYRFLKAITGLQHLSLGVRLGGVEQGCPRGSCGKHKASRVPGRF